jgi:hypothetical protein
MIIINVDRGGTLLFVIVEPLIDLLIYCIEENIVFHDQ